MVPNEGRTPEGAGIALVGYRGTGKSTVGRLVARRLDRAFIDTDIEIAARAGMKVAEVFRRMGEPAFRELEARVIQDCARLSGLVLATGGGAVLKMRNVYTLRRFGWVAWLAAPPEVLAERLRDDPAGPRPGLTPAGPIAEIGEVLQARTPYYAMAADLAIPTEGIAPAEVAERVIRGWRAARMEHPR